MFQPKNKIVTPKSVFHYTTTMGLYGILRSRRLRATHYSSLNDSQEINYSKELLRAFAVNTFDNLLFQGQRITRDYSEKLALVVVDKIIYETAFQGAPEFRKTLSDMFIASFCTVSDGEFREDIYQNGLLSQWRSYGVGGGYAIEFDCNLLAKAIGFENDNFGYFPALDMHPAIYGRLDKIFNSPENKIFFESIIEMCKSYIEMREPDQTVQYMQGSDLYLFAASLKHPGFAEEAEMRIVANTFEILSSPEREAALKRKAFKPTLIDLRRERKYIELFNQKASSDAFMASITRIIIGPHHNQSERKRKLEQFLTENHLNKIALSVSDIPYRESDSRPEGRSSWDFLRRILTTKT